MAYTLNIDEENQTVFLVWRDIVSVEELMGSLEAGYDLATA